jgi:DNA polymerase I-like protein with 3'-5' exonuclease and polymerase domains
VNPPDTTWLPPDMATLPMWKHEKRGGIDLETCDPTLKDLGPGVRRGAYVVGVSFAFNDHQKYYLPMRHAGGGNLDEAKCWDYVRDNLAKFAGEVVGANLSYDLDYLLQNGCQFSPDAMFRDVQIADPLLYELHLSYTLQDIAERWGLAGKDEALLRSGAASWGVDPKAEMWKLHSGYVGAYAEEDAALPLAILEKQEKQIERDGLRGVWDLESRVLPCLVRMRRRGVRVNFERLAAMEFWSLGQENSAYKTVFEQTGIRLSCRDLHKADNLAPALRAAGLDLKTTATGKTQVDAALLKLEGPVPAAISWARKMNKLRTTFAASIREHAIGDRIHCSFQQIAMSSDDGKSRGVRYGRMSCVNPNMQQQPARDSFAKEWRAIYIPEPGMLWSSNDYSQQEPRWTTHFAAELGLQGAEDAARAYHENPLLDNHEFMAQLTGLPRKVAKALFLGLCYGEGGAKLSRDCGLDTSWAMVIGRDWNMFDTRAEAEAEFSNYMLEFPESTPPRIFETAGKEGKHIVDTFNERAPYIKQLAKHYEAQAKKKGFVTTVAGRRLHFPKEGKGYGWTYKALNRVIQGSSADQTKEALVALDAAGHYLQLQIHDEMCASVPDLYAAECIGETMGNIRKSLVPFRVDTEIGPSWGEAV